MSDGNGRAPITAATTVREAVQHYPGIEAIFDKYGLMGCGGPEGPPEIIAFFAKVHGVDVQTLLEELNGYAAKRKAKRIVLPCAVFDTQPTPASGPSQTTEPRSYTVLFLKTAVALTFLLGLPLGLAAPLRLALGDGGGSFWSSHVQAHGQAQVLGWVGLFIMGVAYHVLPRFKMRPLALPGLVLPSFAMMLAGVLLRLLSQPLAGHPALDGLLVLSAALALGGEVAFALVVLSTLRAAPRRETYDFYVATAAVWLLIQGVMNLALVVSLVLDGGQAIPQERIEPLLYLQLYGFAATFILGVSLRTLPLFLNLRPSKPSPFLVILGVLSGGLALRAGGAWAGAYGGWDLAFLEQAGVYIVAIALLAYVYFLNLFRPSAPSPIVDAERGYVKVVRTAYLWLAVAVGLEAYLATRAVTGGASASYFEGGAARHVLALGFITMMIFGMASRVVPVFMGRQLYSQKLLLAAFALLNGAIVARVVPVVVLPTPTTSDFTFLAVAGFLALAAVAAFGYNLWRTAAPPLAAVAPPVASELPAHRSHSPAMQAALARHGPQVQAAGRAIPSATADLRLHGSPGPGGSGMTGGPVALDATQRTPSHFIEKKEGGDMENQPITKDMVVADILERVPAALDILIRHGFAPLADPNLRRVMTPTITLEQASQLHPADLGVLLAEINQAAARVESRVLDVRDMPPWERHPAIFGILKTLLVGEALLLINDHDPKPLYYQLMAERPDQFGWECHQEGPREWRATIERVAEG